MRRLSRTLATLALACAAVPALAQQPPAVEPDTGNEAAPGESEQDALARRATDPTASPPSFAAINEWTASYRDLADGTPIDEDGFGLQLGKVQKVAGQPMRLSVNPQYDMKDLPGIGRFKVQFAIQLILPEGKK